MKCVVSNVNNILEVSSGRHCRVYYLSKNIICRVKRISCKDFFKIKRIIINYISEFSEDKNMLFHYKIVVDRRIYLIIYCIKEQMEDENISSKNDIFPVQFLINSKYSRKSSYSNILCIIYKINLSIYIIYSRKKSIIYSRIIDLKSIEVIEDIIRKDIETLSEELEDDYDLEVISNIKDLKISYFKLKYLEDDIDALSI